MFALLIVLLPLLSFLFVGGLIIEKTPDRIYKKIERDIFKLY